MKRFAGLAMVLLFMAGASKANVITINTFNNQTTWQNTVGSWTTFAFTGNFNSTPGGTTINPAVSGANGYSGIVGNVFQDVLTTGQIPNAVEPTLCCLSTTTVSWSGGPMFAVGGLWNTAPVNEGGKINITLNLVGGGTQFVSTLGPINGFFGWTSSTAFNSFTLSTNNNLFDNFGRPYGVEHYNLDNLQIATVPEPAALSMLGLGLLGLGAIRRYRRR